MAAGKAYLVLPTEANVVNVLFDGEATNIGNEALRMKNQRSAPTGKANEESRGSIYDLQGRLVSRGYEGTEVRGYENSLVEGEEGNLAPSHPRTLAPSIKKGIYVVDGRKVVVK